MISQMIMTHTEHSIQCSHKQETVQHTGMNTQLESSGKVSFTTNCNSHYIFW